MAASRNDESELSEETWEFLLTDEDWEYIERTVSVTKRDGVTNLSTADWETHKDTIRTIYLDKDKSLPATRRIMYERFGILPSERMYKSRFITWEWRRKKLTQNIYNAMNTVHDYLCAQSGLPVALTVQTGRGEKEHQSQKTRKQLNRPAKDTENGWVTMNLDEAIQVLLSQKHLHPRISYGGIEMDLETLSNSGLQAFSNLLPALLPRGGSLPASPLSEGGALSQQMLSSSPYDHRRASLTDLADIKEPFLGLPSRCPSGWCPRCPQSSAHQDFDFDNELAVSMDALTMRRPQSPIMEGPKSLVSRWSVPYVLECFISTAVTQLSESAINFSKHSLMVILNAIEDNEYLLPCVQWTTCVLFYNCRREQFLHFVEESARLITAANKPTSVLRLPLLFLCAWLRNDEVGIRQVGDQLEHTYSQVRASFGDYHLNTIVYSYYRCWYALEYQNAASQVRDELREALPALRRRLGRHNSLVLTCMVMLGRCHLRLKDHHEAALILREALHEMGQPSQYMKAYQLRVLDLLATAEIRSGEYTMAEHHLRDVLAGRIELFGLVSGNLEARALVWETIFELRELLSKLGRGDDAHRLKCHYDMLYEEARSTWYVDRNCGIPPENMTWA